MVLVRVLLIEDHEPLVRALKRGLEEEGFAVDSAKDGGYGSILSATDNCFWSRPGCGPNQQPFSWHRNGCYMVFVDGHTEFIRDSVSRAILRALVTRDQGRFESAVDSVIGQ